jgi:hypothetical protein
VRFLLIILTIWSVAVSLSLFPTDIRLANAFINDEIASQPGINITEICNNKIDDDGDGLVDDQDANDCFVPPTP